MQSNKLNNLDPETNKPTLFQRINSWKDHIKSKYQDWHKEIHPQIISSEMENMPSTNMTYELKQGENARSDATNFPNIRDTRNLHKTSLGDNLSLMSPETHKNLLNERDNAFSDAYWVPGSSF